MSFPDFLKPTTYPKPSGTLVEQLQRSPGIGSRLANATLLAWSNLEPIRYLCLGFPTRKDLAGARASYTEIVAEVERITGVRTAVVLVRGDA